MVEYHFKKRTYNKELKTEFTKSVSEMRKMFSDHEIRLLLFWILIGPLCALAYVVWKKYDKFRLLALILFVASLFYFVGQFGGLFYIFSRIFG